MTTKNADMKTIIEDLKTIGRILMPAGSKVRELVYACGMIGGVAAAMAIANAITRL